MPATKLKEFLDSQGVKYVAITHSPAFTAQEIAAAAHVPGKELAKTVMIKVDGRMAMAVLPASSTIDFNPLKTLTGAGEVLLAGEDDFRGMFPECEVGAMPPFGNLYAMDVYVEKALAEDELIVFNAGTHKELVKLAYADFERLVHPTVGAFARHG